MKKKVFLFLFVLLLFPISVEAKACKVINGTGNDYGDEIACGSEHFYLLEKNDTTLKLLAKYNLYVGDKIDKDPEVFKVEDYASANDAQYAAYEHCLTLEPIYGEENVNTTGKFTLDGNPTEYFCRIYTPLEYDKVQQNELATGLYPNGNLEITYPIYGSVYLDLEVGPKEFDENLDMIPETSQFSEYFTEYKNTLTDIGVKVDDIGFIKRSGIEKFIKAVTNSDFHIPTLDPTDINQKPDESLWFKNYDLYVYKYNIKEYVPEKYNWLYKTTYWVGSASLYKNEFFEEYYDEFLSTVGDYCSYGRGCRINKMGVGLRPVITIDQSEIEMPDNYGYKFIKGDNQKFLEGKVKDYTFTIDGNYSLFESLQIGDLDLTKNEDYTVTEGSTIITFTENGLKKLNSLLKGEYLVHVKYSNNKEVKGKLIITDNLDNPKTLDNITNYFVIGGISLVGIIGSTIYIKKKNKKNKN